MIHGLCKPKSTPSNLLPLPAAVYTYSQYIQPITADTLYPIPGGTMLEDEIKLRIENQPLTPGQG